MNKKYNTIAVSKETKEKLGEYGKKSETYDQVIQRLIIEARRNEMEGM